MIIVEARLEHSRLESFNCCVITGYYFIYRVSQRQGIPVSLLMLKGEMKIENINLSKTDTASAVGSRGHEESSKVKDAMKALTQVSR